MSSSSQKYDLGGKDHLPPVNGPKLSPFKYRRKPIEFLELLSSPEGSSESGGHGHVFKIRVQGQHYALKVFKFFDIREARSRIFPVHNYMVDDNTFKFHSDPFFAECRAYGKIKELERKRKATSRGGNTELAVPCYGFMGLHASPYEQLLEQQFGVRAWNRLPSDSKRPVEQRTPFRCIVKKFMSGDHLIKHPGKMLRDLRRLRKAGVYQRDVFERNYMDGLLVDFSIAWTAPHWTASVLSASNVVRRQDLELYDFDIMIEDSGVKTAVRATRNEEMCRRLRSHEAEDSDSDS